MSDSFFNLPHVTVREFAENGNEAGEPVFIHTHRGFERVSHIRWPETNPWAVCPDANGGFGSSYCVCYDVRLYLKSALVKAGLVS